MPSAQFCKKDVLEKRFELVSFAGRAQNIVPSNLLHESPWLTSVFHFAMEVEAMVETTNHLVIEVLLGCIHALLSSLADTLDFALSSAPV